MAKLGAEACYWMGASALYLADRVLRIARGIEEDSLIAQSANVAYMAETCRRIINDHRLYVFERSALAAAADLRIDTPERLEAVLEAVLERPRRAFIEARHKDRAEVLSRIRGFPIQSLKPGRRHPHRVGLIVDVYGGGRANISVLWDFRSGDAPGRLTRSDVISLPRNEREATIELSMMGLSFSSIEVDLSRRASVSREEFAAKAASAENEGQYEAFFAAARRIVKAGDGSESEQRVITEAWRMARLNEFCAMSVPEGAYMAATEIGFATDRLPDQVIDDSASDLDGEIVHAVAMLALLEIETPDIKRRIRLPPNIQQKRGRRRRLDARKAESDINDRFARLSIVEMSFSDTVLEREYSAKEEGGHSRPEAQKGRPRVRHMVRGHLFRARNGKMVYRRPHWRGAGRGPAIYRVTGPVRDTAE